MSAGRKPTKRDLTEALVRVHAVLLVLADAAQESGQGSLGTLANTASRKAGSAIAVWTGDAAEEIQDRALLIAEHLSGYRSEAGEVLQ